MSLDGGLTNRNVRVAARRAASSCCASAAGTPRSSASTATPSCSRSAPRTPPASRPAVVARLRAGERRRDLETRRARHGVRARPCARRGRRARAARCWSGSPRRCARCTTGRRCRRPSRRSRSRASTRTARVPPAGSVDAEGERLAVDRCRRGSPPRSAGPSTSRCPATTTCCRRTSCATATRSTIIDWEYAGMNDRYFDLGNLAVNNELGHDDELRLLEAYFGEPPTAAAHRRAAPDAAHVRRRARRCGASSRPPSATSTSTTTATRARTSRGCARPPPIPRLEEWLDAAAA